MRNAFHINANYNRNAIRFLGDRTIYKRTPCGFFAECFGDIAEPWARRSRNGRHTAWRTQLRMVFSLTRICFARSRRVVVFPTWRGPETKAICQCAFQKPSAMATGDFPNAAHAFERGHFIEVLISKPRTTGLMGIRSRNRTNLL